MSEVATAAYFSRMQRVLEHIDRHLDETLDVDRLAGVAAFSRHHFQRQFSALFGVGVNRYVQLLRLKRASYRLAFRADEPVTAIALDSGYEAPEAFGRAFRQRLEQTPSAFRDEPDWSPWHAAMAPLNQARSRGMKPTFTPDQVRLIDFPETRVAVLAHRGDPATIGHTLRQFIAWRKETRTVPPRSATFNVFHDDPEEVAPEDYRLDLCAAVTGPVGPNAQGVKAGVIPGGRCAVLRVTGSSDDLRRPMTWLYGEWLPASGEEPADRPPFAQRVSFFPDVPEHEAVTDLFLPVR